MYWLAIKERESQVWKLKGPTESYVEKIGRKKERRYKSWVIPKPEHVSPFIETHIIIKADTQEEAECQISSLK